MTVRVNFTNGTTQEFTNIRMTTVYTRPGLGGAAPDIVLHGKEPQWGQTNLPLQDIDNIVTIE